MKIRICCLAVAFVFAAISCRRNNNDFGKYSFTTDHINKYTPIRDQGRKQICWAYAMLATVEGDRLALGDSVCVSPFFLARNYLLEQAGEFYCRKGKKTFTLRATALTALRLLEEHGAMPYDAYSHGERINFNTLVENVEVTSQQAVQKKVDTDRFRKNVEDAIDKCLGYPTPHVHMYGAEYTPGEFARSVCPPDEYIGFTSFTHHPFYGTFALEVPDNYDDSEYYNLPIEELTGKVIKAVRDGRNVCWEGDVSEEGFSFKDGVAVFTENINADELQERRQRMFENSDTADDHCMCIIGLAHDQFGTQYFIMKNSWGDDSRYKGLMYMSMRYFKMKTIAVVMSKDYRQSTSQRQPLLLPPRNYKNI